MTNHNQLSEYVKNNIQKVVKGDLRSFMQLHPKVFVEEKCLLTVHIGTLDSTGPGSWLSQTAKTV